MIDKTSKDTIFFETAGFLLFVNTLEAFIKKERAEPPAPPCTIRFAYYD